MAACSWPGMDMDVVQFADVALAMLSFTHLHLVVGGDVSHLNFAEQYGNIALFVRVANKLFHTRETHTHTENTHTL